MKLAEAGTNTFENCYVICYMLFFDNYSPAGIAKLTEVPWPPPWRPLDPSPSSTPLHRISDQRIALQSFWLLDPSSPPATEFQTPGIPFVSICFPIVLAPWLVFTPLRSLLDLSFLDPTSIPHCRISDPWNSICFTITLAPWHLPDPSPIPLRPLLDS